ncbi:MAG: T9SS type A sorting domain-containing protein [Bacteroidetes bacterium]|nr:T9SS type A sorting domain-containing protein [Bacteroidota bacterium]MCB0844364.1 T9SS type A sorting domain-containing protein [Bacteroidota bacterium]
MKSTFLICFLLSAGFLWGQGFLESGNNSLEGVAEGSIAFSDVNGDSYPDLLITGKNLSLEPVTKLYLNDSTGQFTEVSGTPFDAVCFSSVAFADVNGDNFPDLLITGRNQSFEHIAKLYMNDGTGQFSEVMGTPFEGIIEGAVAFSDVNGDTYPDLLLTGGNQFGQPVAKLYVNNGTGQFTENTNAPFVGVYFSSVAFADINHDTYPDVLITGQNSSSNPVMKLYTNNGTGNFTEMQGTSFGGIVKGSVAFSDVNGDTHTDLIFSGNNSEKVTELYTNDGLGHFTRMSGMPFEGVFESSIAVADVNGDDRKDLLISGSNSSINPVTKLYLSDSTGQFSEVWGTPFEDVSVSAVAFADINKDFLPDLIITGRNSSHIPITKLYVNDGTVSIKDHHQEIGKIHLYPNPVKNGKVKLNLNNIQSQSVQISLLDINGKEILQQQQGIIPGQQELSLDLPTLVNGMYFVQVEAGENRKVLRMLVD